MASPRVEFRFSGKTGIALLEVLVSVSIIAFGVSAPLVSFRVSAKMQVRLEQRQLGRDLAERKCADVRLGTPGESEGFFDPPFEKYAWRIQLVSAEQDVPFQFVRIFVSRQTRDKRENLYVLETLIPASNN